MQFQLFHSFNSPQYPSRGSLGFIKEGLKLMGQVWPRLQLSDKDCAFSMKEALGSVNSKNPKESQKERQRLNSEPHLPSTDTWTDMTELRWHLNSDTSRFIQHPRILGISDNGMCMCTQHDNGMCVCTQPPFTPGFLCCSVIACGVVALRFLVSASASHNAPTPVFVHW